MTEGPVELAVGDGDLAAVDVATALFASVLMLLVLVSLTLLPTSPPKPLPSTGQLDPTATAVPPTWEALPQRTSYALLRGSRLSLLDLDHFARSALSPLHWIDTPEHRESVRPQTHARAPEALTWTLTTTGQALPAAWVRFAMDLPAVAPGTPCPLDALGSTVAHRPVWTVLVHPAADAALQRLAAFADACGLGYRLALPAPPDDPDDPVTIPMALDPSSFALERLFR
ncbi:MAG: hypothetical protein ACFCBW_15250 [Candidatus Competibacterales bacterium]